MTEIQYTKPYRESTINKATIDSEQINRLIKSSSSHNAASGSNMVQHDVEEVDVILEGSGGIIETEAGLFHHNTDMTRIVLHAAGIGNLPSYYIQATQVPDGWEVSPKVIRHSSLPVEPEFKSLHLKNIYKAFEKKEPVTRLSLKDRIAYQYSPEHLTKSSNRLARVGNFFIGIAAKMKDLAA